MKEIRKYEMSEIKAIGEINSSKNDQLAEDYFFSDDTSLGGFWHSRRTLVEEVTYETSLPQGIHFSAGISDISIAGPSLGEYFSNGVTVTYAYSDGASDERFRTTIAEGKTVSCGLYISLADDKNLPDDVEVIFDKFPKKNDFQASSNVSALIIDKLCQPISDWYQGDARQLIAEAKAYELLATAIAVFSNPTLKPKANIKHAMMARDIIESDLMNTPNLQLLAKQAGLNVRSLTQVFKEVFGVSINQYITKQRMEKAVVLLESGLSVSQTAYKIGYSAPYFSEIFQRRFSMLPSDVGKRNSLPKI